MATLTLEQKRLGGLRSVEARRQIAMERYERSMQINALVDAIGDPQQIPKLAYGTAMLLMQKVAAGAEDLPLDTTLDLTRTAEAAKTLFSMGRLASGESTQNIMHASVNTEQVAAIVARAQALNADNPTD